MNLLAQKIDLKSNEIANYLARYLEQHKSFVYRSFYGESFTMTLLDRHGILSNDLKKILISEYQKKDKNDSEFHFEFNNYAFSDYLDRHHQDDEVRKLFFPLRFKGTPCTNWTFLRSNVRLKEKMDEKQAKREAENKLQHCQMDNGLILDDPGVKSFQYHCFSAAMLEEIFQSTKEEKYQVGFIKAVDFIRSFILKNGEALYVGRGQEQSFGLGVLVYILAKYYEMTKEKEVLGEITVVLNFISKFQYDNGAFPLVFTGLENKNPANVKMLEPEFSGWYPYNNFFDYLPFLGFFLHKAAAVLEKQPIRDDLIGEIKTKEFRDASFIRINKKKYSAILSLPGGYWTNDLPIPLVMKDNKFITPMLGGEQFQQSLYRQDALSMPTTIWGNKSWRQYGRGFFLGNGMIWISAFGILYRSYRFQEETITISNHALSWIPSLQNFSLLSMLEKKNDFELSHPLQKIKFSGKILSVNKGYSAMGELKVVKTKMNVRMTMELL